MASSSSTLKKFAADVGTDLAAAQAEYIANSQMPVAAVSFNAPVTAASVIEAAARSARKEPATPKPRL
jgi:hypothetical protein